MPERPGRALRILQLNSVMTGGGTDDHILKLAQGLKQAGQEVWVAGPDRRECSRIAREVGVPFHPTPSEGFARNRFILDASRFIREQKIQIVHGHHGRDLWPAIFAARLSGVRPKIVLTRHLAKSPSSWASRRFLLGQCDVCLAVSEFVAKVMREGVYEPDSPVEERRARPPLRGNHQKIRLAYGGIDTERFQPAEAEETRQKLGLKPADFAFAVIGAYHLPRGKGQREFLRAAVLARERIPNARFLIIGRGDMGEALQGDITRLGLTGSAWLAPYSSDMPGVMNAIDCLVNPQVATEAFSLVACEAQACGRPVIASALDGIPETLVDNNWSTLVKPASVEELARAMISWAGRPRPDLAQRWELHGKLAAKFSLTAATGRVLQIYRELVPGGTSVNN